MADHLTFPKIGLPLFKTLKCIKNQRWVCLSCMLIMTYLTFQLKSANMLILLNCANMLILLRLTPVRWLLDKETSTPSLRKRRWMKKNASPAIQLHFMEDLWWLRQVFDPNLNIFFNLCARLLLLYHILSKH